MTSRCLADVGGPFYDAAKPFRNWSALPFYQLDLDIAPYVDIDQLAWGVERAKAYLAQIHAQGYTGIVIDNMAHLVTFERAPVAIYAPDSPYRMRAEIYREAFRGLFEEAARLGMEVFVTSDMQWSTPPVRRYAGRLTPRNSRIADVNRWALEELFTELPQVSGLFFRVGETGGAHNQGSAYAGHMLYTTPESLRDLIDTLLPMCEAHDRLLIVRTWSIGIGELGDLMWSPERYRETFEKYTSPHLLVSIKHGPSDFFRLLPHNPTLGLPGPAQIVEVQNRREYELFGMIPTSIADLHQDVVHHATNNPQFAGLWAWNASGGWGGGTAALGNQGWSVWTELSSALTAALLHDPGLDTRPFVRQWCVERFGADFGLAVADTYLDSGDIVERGWYLGSFTHNQQTLGAIYLPSLIWVWWMRPTASLIFWAYLATVITDRDQLIQNGADALLRLDVHLERLSTLAPADNAQAFAIVESVRYLRDILTVAQVSRTLMLRAFDAAWKNDRAAWNDLAQEAVNVRAVLRAHRAMWIDRADLPPLELDELYAFLRAFQRAPGLIWPQARTACLFVNQVTSRRTLGRRTRIVGMSAAAVLLLSLFTQGRRGIGVAGFAGALASVALTPTLRQRTIRATLPWLSRQFYLLPSIFFETGPSFTEWTA
jgi:hypothetical protein